MSSFLLNYVQANYDEIISETLCWYEPVLPRQCHITFCFNLISLILANVL